MKDESPFLPDIYSRYFELRRLGLSLEEIGAALGIPEEAMAAFVELATATLTNLGDDALR